MFPVRVEGGAPCTRGAEQCAPVPGPSAPCAVCQPGIVMQALLQKQRVLMGFVAHQVTSIVIWVPGSVCSQDAITHVVRVQVTD